MKYIVINDLNQIMICYLESQSHLPPDERREIEIIDEYQEGDNGYINFMSKISKLVNYDNLDMNDLQNLLKIYRKS